MTSGRWRRLAALVAVLIAVPAAARADQYTYSMTVRVRPLLLFWISRSGVGGAVVTRERTADYQRYSLLIGSDPDRAPRRINRWGYIQEEIRADEARLIGLMTQSDEESVEQAEASLRAPSAARHPFRVIQATVNGDRASSRVATITAPENLTFHQLARALDLARSDATAGTSRTLRLVPGVRTGFLAALADAMRSGTTDPIRYVYYGRLYELRQMRIRSIANVHVGNGDFGRGASADFVVTSLHDGEETRFAITYGTDGRFAGVPLTVAYQPRWWMQVNLAIDESAAVPAVAEARER